MSAETREKKLELIAQLLAKAESTTPEEAEALTEAAERMMIRYGIDQAVIDARRAAGEREPIVEKKVRFKGAYAHDMLDLGRDVVFGLGTLHPLQAKDRGWATLFIIGFESDVDQAVLLVRSLELQGMVAMRDWWARERKSDERYWRTVPGSWAQRARGDFIRGFGQSAGSRIRANRKQIVEEAGTGTELVLASRRDRVKAQVGEMYPGLKEARVRKPPGYGQGFGYSKGLEANTGERQVRGADARAIGAGR